MSQISDTAVINAEGGLVELGYGEILSNVTVSSTTESSGTTVVPAITVVSDGSPVDIEFFSARVVVPGHPSGNYIVFNVVIDGTTRGRLGVVYSTGTTQLDVPVNLKFRTTLSAGSHTVAVSAYRYNADCTVDANGTAVNFEMPTFLRVNKIVTAAEWPAINEQNRIICTSSTRPSAPYEGIKIYETDTDRELVYDSSAWVQTNSIGGWSTWTPEVYQNGTRSSTANYAKYTRIGDTAIVQAKISMTAAGQAGYQIEVRDLPYGIAGNSTYLSVGGGMYWDQNFRWLLHAESWAATNTTITFGYDSAAVATYAGGRFGEHPSKAIVSGDFLTFYLNYEIA